MYRFIAKSIGPLLLGLGALPAPMFIEVTPENQGYIVFLALWSYGVGYIDHKNSDWADSL